MSKKIGKLLASIVSHTLNHIWGYVVTTSGAAVFVYAYFSGMLAAMKTVLIEPLPAYASVISALSSVALLYLIHFIKTKKSKEFIKTENYQIGNHKWKSHIRKDGSFRLEFIPYCPTHNVKFYEVHGDYQCPATKCQTPMISTFDMNSAYDCAHSVVSGAISGEIT